MIRIPDRIPEGQRCGAQTNKGHYCRRKAKAAFKIEWEDRFLFFFKKKEVHFYYYCTQHAAGRADDRVA